MRTLPALCVGLIVATLASTAAAQATGGAVPPPPGYDQPPATYTLQPTTYGAQQPGAPMMGPTVAPRTIELSVPNPFLLDLGRVGFGVSYGLAAVTTLMYILFVLPIQAALEEDNLPSAFPMWLALPVIGPAMAAQEPVAADSPALRTLLWFDAVTQGVCLISWALAYALPRTITTTTVSRDDGPSIMVAGGPLGSWGATVYVTVN